MSLRRAPAAAEGGAGSVQDGPASGTRPVTANALFIAVALLLGLAFVLHLARPERIAWSQNFFIVFGAILLEAIPFVLIGAVASAIIEVFVPPARSRGSGSSPRCSSCHAPPSPAWPSPSANAARSRSRGGCCGVAWRREQPSRSCLRRRSSTPSSSPQPSARIADGRTSGWSCSDGSPWGSWWRSPSGGSSARAARRTFCARG